MSDYSIYTTAAIIGFICIYYWLKRHHRTRGLNIPPCCGSTIPWLGCVIEFGKAPLHFIDQARTKYGPIFTLKVTGQRLTFLTDVEDFHNFFQSQHVDFQQAVQKPVNKTASISRESFEKYHTYIHDTVKACLAPIHLSSLCAQLADRFNKQLERRWGNQGESVDLNGIVRTTMYICVLDNLMGEGVMPTTSEKEYHELEDHFVRYDDQFEYGSQLPEFFFKDWSTSKRWLLELFQKIVAKLQSSNISAPSDKSVLRSLLEVVDEKHQPNYSLLLMWASLANAIPMTFWTLAFILSNAEIARDVRAEIDRVLADKPTGVGRTCAVVDQADLQRMPKLKCCIFEAIRLRAPGVITRQVIKSFQVNGYTIPEGDRLMLSPYWSHRNPELFPDPELFNPDRWASVDLEKGGVLKGFVAFGGGRYQCPGRWFALMEIQLFIALVLRSYDITLLEPVPACSPLHLVGTQQPVGTLLTNYKRRL